MTESTDRNATPAADSARIKALLNRIRQALDAPTLSRPALDEIRAGYAELTRADKPVFFRELMESLETKPEALLPLLEEARSGHRDPARWRQALTALRAGAESPRQRLFHRFVGLPGGLKFLLDFRADILAAQREGVQGLEPLDHDLVAPFEALFHDGFLSLKEITLDSPYRQIELIKSRDMVHPMTSLEEMGQRLGRDRRCFALYHLAMPEEPVVFIEAALTRGVARSIHEIIGSEAGVGAKSERKDTAVFYSINNTQNGLAGLGLGQVLIYEVVAFLRREAPEIKTFCTLSPMPGFWRRFLKPLLDGTGQGLKTDTAELENLFGNKVRELLLAEHHNLGGERNPPLPELLLSVFSDLRWAENAPLVKALERPLRRLGYVYAGEEKDPRGRPLDPVANFHLGNGASVSYANVNFQANRSPAGLTSSLSLMVNYMYSQTWSRQIQSTFEQIGGMLPGLTRSIGFGRVSRSE